MLAKVEPKADGQGAQAGAKAQSGTRQARGRGSEAEALAVGDMVDHFRVERLIGMGGMGAVYVAQDTKLGRDVALKVVQAEVLGSHDAVERFIYEAQTTARLNHPHIVTIYAVGEHEGQPYVALELVEGDSLEAQLDEALPSVRDAVSIALTITEAVAVAHEHGVLHRDLKPANVVVPPDGRLRVLDFGLAKRVLDVGAPRSQAFDGKVEPKVTYAGAGTPAYMAPEQWLGEASSRQTDVWAIGMILFELCSGRLPYEEDLAFEQAQRVCGAELAPRLDEMADVPKELADVAARCLQKLPDERPSAKEVAQDLSVLLERLAGESALSSSETAEPQDPAEREAALRDTERAEAPVAVGPGHVTSREAGPGVGWLWTLPLLISAVLLWFGRDVWLAPERTPSSPSSPLGSIGAATPSGKAQVSPLGDTAVQPRATGSAAPTASVVRSPPPLPGSSGTGLHATQAPRRPTKSRALPSPTAAARASLPPFDHRLAARKLAAAVIAAKDCKHPGAPPFVAVLVTFAPSGTVTEVRPLNRGGKEGQASVQCVVAQFRGIVIPPFSGAPISKSKTVTLAGP